MVTKPNLSEPESILDSISRLSRSPRQAGSREDTKALVEMQAAIESTGRFCVEEIGFEFQSFVPTEWNLSIDGERAESIPAVCSASTSVREISAPLRRSESEDVDGAVVLLRIADVHESIAVENLAKRGAVAVIAFQSRGPTLVGRVRYPRSSIPCMMIGGKLGEGLWERSATRGPTAEVSLKAQTVEARGTNLYAVPREARPRLLFTAHRDSRPFSPGALDNASGSAFLLSLAVSSRDPRFSLLSTDAEEYGLLGARAFARAQERIDKAIEVVNLDSIGSGQLHLVERSRAGPLSEHLNTRIDTLANAVGVRLGRMLTPRGSDSDIFMEAGLRSCWIRSYPTPTATTVDDRASHLDLGILGQCAAVLRGLVGAIPFS